MGKRLHFKWVSPVGDSEACTGSYEEGRLAIGYACTEAPLASVAEIAKQIEALKDVALTLGVGYDSVGIDGLTTPIQLTEHIDVDDFAITGNGPSLEWLLEHTKDLSNPNPNKVFYVDNTVMQFSGNVYSGGTGLVILDIAVVKTFVDETAGTYIERLDGTFDEFLESYGYTDARILKDVPYLLTIYQAAKDLGFNDPKEVVTYFGDRRLIADLTLKGVFEGIRNY